MVAPSTADLLDTLAGAEEVGAGVGEGVEWPVLLAPELCAGVEFSGFTEGLSLFLSNMLLTAYVNSSYRVECSK